MSEIRTRLEKEICSRYNLDQLDAVVKAALKESRESFAIKDNLPAVVFELFEQLEQQDKKLLRFLIFLKETTNRPELRSAIADYLNECLGVNIPESDPYAEIVTLGEPFVNRQTLKEMLRTFFTNPNKRVMGTQGVRYCGRSYARYFIQHITRKEGFDFAYIDMLNTNVREIISELINTMRLPVNDFRDRLAQASTQTKGFISALKGYAREFRDAGKRWCIVFDHHDLDEVTPEVKEFAEMFIQSAINQDLENIWIIVLGFGPWTILKAEVYTRILAVPTLSRIEKQDVDRFIDELIVLKSETLTTQQVEARKTEIFQSLILPLNLEDMRTLCRRLRNYC